MQPRSHYTHTNFGQTANSRRRIRRTSTSNRLFCTTNGCATFLQLDATGNSATCPICGARKTLH
jgi:transcription initiation factor IIE alpha subunit